MAIWKSLDRLDRLFVVWAFLLIIVLIVHFAIRKPLMESYTTKFGWIVYTLSIPSVVISIILYRGGKSWSFWLGGILFLMFAIFGFWVDYLAKIQFRNPLRLEIVIPYVSLYLAMIMFYWWPLGRIDRKLWIVYAFLFVLATVLNIGSH